MNNCLFDNSFRLRSLADFTYLKIESKKLYLPGVIAYFKNSRVDLNVTRIGISVSKKIGNACVRNRIKRLVRETFRKSSFKNLNVDILFVVKAKNNSVENNEKIIINSVYDALKKIKGMI